MFINFIIDRQVIPFIFYIELPHFVYTEKADHMCDMVAIKAVFEIQSRLLLIGGKRPNRQHDNNIAKIITDIIAIP